MNDVLRVGDRVRMTDVVWDKCKGRPSQTGTVVGFSRTDHFVHVRLDGDDHLTTWHLDCWRVDDDGDDS
jgi:hypothetical protein